MMGGIGFAGMGLGWILWIAVLVFVVVILARSFTSRGHHTEPPAAQGENAMDILRQRYAKGELSEKEFHRMAEQLKR